MMNMGTTGFGMGLGGIGMILVWVVLIAVVVIAVRWAIGLSGSADSKRGDGKTALQILEERYAKGEIDRAEYEQKKKDLQH